MEYKLKQLIENSERVLITSHISPDADAVSSVLLFDATLNLNYPDKKIAMVLEEGADELNFLSGYKTIEIRSLAEALDEYKPDLMVILDANNFKRLSRHDGENIRQFVKSSSIKTVIIDHHQPDGRDQADLYINKGSPATIQDVCELLFDGFKLRKPEYYAQTAMTGLFSDTGGFVYENPRHTDTFKLADELVSAGANIELIRNNLYRYSDEDIKVLAELTANASHQADYNYSYVSDKFVEDWITTGKSGGQLHSGTEAFVNGYIRNINGRKWGFIVYKNVLSGDDIYSASFRAVGGIKDVAEIAAKLGGGGHKGAAGAKFEANSAEEAIKKVIKIIYNV